MSARDRDPELAKERAFQAELGRILNMDVPYFVDNFGSVRVKVKDIATDRYLSDYVGLAHITVDLQSLIEAVAQAEVDK